MSDCPQTVCGAFVRALALYPERGFLRGVEGGSLSYREASVRILQLTEQLTALGLRRGDRVLLYTEATVPLVLFNLACAFVGVVPVPLTHLFSKNYVKGVIEQVGIPLVLTAPDTRPHVADLGAKTIVYDEVRLAPTVRDVVAFDDGGAAPAEAQRRLEAYSAQVSGQDTFMIQPTSGSTGQPKLVVRKHLGFSRYAKYVGREIGTIEAPPERFLSVAALTHAFGLHMFTTAMSLGAELMIPTHLDTSARIEDVRELNPTVIPMTPRVLRAFYLQQQGGDSSAIVLDPNKQSPVGRLFGPSAKLALLAGGAADPVLLRSLHDQGVGIIEFYGSSEASLIALTPRNHWKPGCAGRVVEDVQIRIESDSEVLVKSPGLMSEYFNEPERTAEVYTADGYYHTGDFGTVDGEGFLRILGRKRDVFNTPEGSNIYPERIERMLESLPWVSQAFLVGDQRPFISAFVVVNSGKESLLEMEPDGALRVDRPAPLIRRAGEDIAKINEQLERNEQIICCALLGRAFHDDVYATVGGGKIRRNRKSFVTAFASRIGQIYAPTRSLVDDFVMFVPGVERRLRPRR